MTRWTLGLLLSLPVGFFIGLWLFALIVRRYATDPHAVSSGYRYRFEGQDDTLRQRTEERRASAAQLRKQAARLDAQHDEPLSAFMRRVR